MLEDVSGSDQQPRLPSPAHQLYRADAVAPKLKEVVLDPDPREAKGLGKERAEDLFLGRSGRLPGRSDPKLRGGQRLAIQLAVGGQRQSLQHHDSRRHHVVGQTLAKVAP